MKRVLNRPTRVESYDDVNKELSKIYDLLNNILLSTNVFDDSRNTKGKAGDIRVSRSKSGEVVLEIRADDNWYSSTEIFSELQS